MNQRLQAESPSLNTAEQTAPFSKAQETKLQTSEFVWENRNWTPNPLCQWLADSSLNAGLNEAFVVDAEQYRMPHNIGRSREWLNEPRSHVSYSNVFQVLNDVICQQ